MSVAHRSLCTLVTDGLSAIASENPTGAFVHPAVELEDALDSVLVESQRVRRWSITERQVLFDHHP